MLRVEKVRKISGRAWCSCLSVSPDFASVPISPSAPPRAWVLVFPVLLSGLIIAIGLVLALKGVAVEGPPIEPVQLRPISFIVAAILIFGFLIRSIGLALTAVLLTIFAAYARPEVKLRETILLGVGLAMFTVLVFVYLLGQALPAWWGR